MINFKNVMYCMLVIGSSLIIVNIVSPAKLKYEICYKSSVCREQCHLIQMGYKIVDIDISDKEYAKITYR
jgi:hypothetical protein